MSSTKKKPAIELFNEAFERLKNNTPVRLPPGTPVTQNNVAREAGRDPSALRSERYPELLQTIQAFIFSRNEQVKESKKTPKNRARKLEQRLADCRKQRDRLSSICQSQQSFIEELMDKIARLEEGKVVDIKRPEY